MRVLPDLESRFNRSPGVCFQSGTQTGCARWARCGPVDWRTYTVDCGGCDVRNPILENYGSDNDQSLQPLWIEHLYHCAGWSLRCMIQMIVREKKEDTFPFQNIFDKGQEMRNMTLSATHLALFRSVRDGAMLRSINSQMMFPKNFLSSAMMDCNKHNCYAPLIINMTPSWNDKCRVYTGKNDYCAIL